MNAPIGIAEHRAERRRQDTISGVQHALRSLVADLDRVRTLGFDSATVAMRTAQRELRDTGLIMHTLEQEFEEMAELAHQQRQNGDTENE